MKPTSPSYRRMYTKKGDSRKSSITKKDRTTITVDRHVLPYINKYAGEHFLYSEEAATKLIAIGVSKVNIEQTPPSVEDYHRVLAGNTDAAM